MENNNTKSPPRGKPIKNIEEKRYKPLTTYLTPSEYNVFMKKKNEECFEDVSQFLRTILRRKDYI